MRCPSLASVVFRSILSGAALALLTAAAITACGGGDTSPTPGATRPDAQTGERPRLAAPLHPPASCPVTIDTPELLATGTHVSEGTKVTYSSSPPSSGPHYATWADFKEVAAPIDDGYLVHSLEHGAVALLYKCEGAACPPIVDSLKKVRDSLPTDPSCDSATRVRVIIAPYPKMDVPVAAVAWGWTYKAQCVDIPTITQFAKDNYAKGPEDLCAAGRTF